MKITRLKLVNFIGIKHGMNLDEVEINFKNRRIVMLNGGNGSGKSTIMSQLHPFKDSFDDRKKIIMDDKDGLKEIDIEHESSKYEIVHIYGKKAQSFIKKDGTEMNENGGVKTFEDYIKSEFGLTTDYFKIGKIGSNTESFIQLTTSERKNYISKFLPAIEDYLEKFEIIKEKFRLAQNDIKTISSELSKLEEESSLKVRIEGLETIIKTLGNDIESKSNQIAVLSSEVQNYKNEIVSIDIAAVTLDMNNKERRKKEIETFAVQFIGKYSKMNTADLEKFVEEKAKEINDLSQEIAVLKSNNFSKNESIVKLQNEISKLKYNLSELKVTESIDVINSKLKTSKEKIEKLKSENKSELFELVKENEKAIPVQLSKFEMMKNFIVKYFNNLKAKSLIPTITNIELFMKEDFITTLQNQIDNVRKLISDKQELLSSQRGLLAQKQADFQKFDAIYKDNNITNVQDIEACRGCPFAKDALEYRNLPQKIAELEKSISAINKDLIIFTDKAEEVSDLKNLYKQFISIYEQLNPRANHVFNYFVNKNNSFISLIVSRNLNDFIAESEQVINSVNKFVFVIQEISKVESEIQNLEYKKNISENNETMKASVEKNIFEKEAELISLKSELSGISSKVIEKNNTLNSSSKILSDHKEHLAGRKERNDIIASITTLEEISKKYNNTKVSISSKEKELVEISKVLTELRDRKNTNDLELTKAKSTMINIEHLKSKKEALNADYNNLKILKDALDPNKGVPLYFIKSYLEKTKDIANELLSLAFGENFEINFVTSDKEFFIQVRAGENVKNDIKEASQGEIAITTISISLALIEQAIGKYNILALDEIDGPLDTSNRANFISILNTQIEKLGIEQVFVISHNDAFDTEEMDLIVLKESNISLKGDDFLKNKEIILEVK
jgi:DNA repair exonuclease SbcCD ATPase subunit